MNKKQFLEFLEAQEIKFKIVKSEIVITKENGDVYLDNLTSLPAGIKFNNHGDVYLDNLTSLPAGIKFNNHGYVSLRSLTSLPAGIKFNNHGDVYLRDGEYKYMGKPLTVKTFDGIQGKLIDHKKSVYKMQKMQFANGQICGEIFYVIEANGVYSHGKTIKEAKKSFLYKIGSRDMSAYKNLKIDSVIRFEDAVKMYRVITGACEYGTRSFVETLKATKKQYSIKEIIDLTNGQYGSDRLKDFFRGANNGN